MSDSTPAISPDGTACPVCCCRDLKVAARRFVTAHLTFSGEGEHESHELTHEQEGDLEWEGDDYAECSQCGHSGTLNDFRPAGHQDSA